MKLVALLLVFCSAAIPSAAPATAPTFSQERVAPLGAEEVAEQHGLILRALGQGELESGVARLSALKSAPGAGGIAEQIQKDIDRCRALIDLRAKHIGELVDKAKRVTLERRQGKVVATVTAFSGGQLSLTGAKTGLEAFPADELLLAPLVREFSPKTLEGVDPAVRGYAFVLAGDAKGLAALKGTPQADQLRREADSFYKGALELGAAAELISALAERGQPTDAAAAKESVAALEQLAARHSSLGLVTRRRRALNALALSAYGFLQDPSKVLEGLSADVEHLPDGRVRLTYDFKKLRRIPDFRGHHDYLEDFRKSVAGPKAPPRDLAIDGGFLRVGGDGVWRHALEFVGPITVTYTSTLDKPDTPPAFMLAVHDDGRGSCIMGWCDGRVSVIEVSTRLYKCSAVPPTRNVTMMKLVTDSLTVADGKAFVLSDGQERSRLDCGSRDRGGLCLVISGIHDVLIAKLVIEARVDVDGMRARWAEERAAELKFR